MSRLVWEFAAWLRLVVTLVHVELFTTAVHSPCAASAAAAAAAAIIITTGEGILAIKAPWPSMMRTVYGDHERFEMTYFSAFKGYYFTGARLRHCCNRCADLLH